MRQQERKHSKEGRKCLDAPQRCHGGSDNHVQTGSARRLARVKGGYTYQLPGGSIFTDSNKDFEEDGSRSVQKYVRRREKYGPRNCFYSNRSGHFGTRCDEIAYKNTCCRRCWRCGYIVNTFWVYSPCYFNNLPSERKPICSSQDTPSNYIDPAWSVAIGPLRNVFETRQSSTGELLTKSRLSAKPSQNLFNIC